MPKSLFTFLLAAFVCAGAQAQERTDKPLSESDLLKQIESLTPSTPPSGKSGPESISLFDTGLGESRQVERKAPLKKSKGPTEITALEATFDQKANLAVFIGDVIVKDPEFRQALKRQLKR